MLTWEGGGVFQLLTAADVGEGGVKNTLKSADVLYGRPLSSLRRKTQTRKENN